VVKFYQRNFRLGLVNQHRLFLFILIANPVISFHGKIPHTAVGAGRKIGVPRGLFGMENNIFIFPGVCVIAVRVGGRRRRSPCLGRQGKFYGQNRRIWGAWGNRRYVRVKGNIHTLHGKAALHLSVNVLWLRASQRVIIRLCNGYLR